MCTQESYLQPCVEDELKDERLEDLSASIHPSPFVAIIYPRLGFLCFVSVCLYLSSYESLPLSDLSYLSGPSASPYNPRQGTSPL